MAQSIRRPLTSVGLLSGKAELRCFSTSTRWLAGGPRQLAPQQPRRQPEKSIKVNAAQNQRINSDLGILPGEHPCYDPQESWLIKTETFIRPRGINKPSIFRAPKDVLELQWERVTRKFKDYLVVLVYYFSAPKGSRPKLNLRQIGPTATALHRQMYTAFAEGDKPTLQKICVDGLRDSFLNRIAARGKAKLQWDLVRYNGSAKVITHRAATLGKEGAGIRQAVVRISSSQRLTRFNPDGSPVDNTGKPRDVVEYLVLQKICMNFVEQDWKVWGTTEETTIEKLRETKLAMLNQ